MHHRPVLVAALAIVLEAGLSVLAPAQTRAPDVGVGFGVDTSRADVGPIVRLVRAYLDRPDSVARSRVLWSAGPSGDRTYDDLAARYTLQGAPASIIGVLPVDDGDSVYVVKLLHARSERAGGPVAPIALERLYAERTPRSPLGWQLAAALPRLTKAWQTRTAGRITFHYAPGQQPNSDRATTAAAFVDSVAALFDVTPPSRIDYYVAGSPDEYFRALGLDFFVLPSGPGESAAGNALPDVGVLLAGDPAQGELYRHELVHVAIGGRAHSAFVGEGVAAWLGGSRRQDARELYRGLAAFQRAHPGVTFATMVRDKLSAQTSQLHRRTPGMRPARSPVKPYFAAPAFRDCARSPTHPTNRRASSAHSQGFSVSQMTQSHSTAGGARLRHLSADQIGDGSAVRFPVVQIEAKI